MSFVDQDPRPKPPSTTLLREALIRMPVFPSSLIPQNVLACYTEQTIESVEAYPARDPIVVH